MSWQSYVDRHMTGRSQVAVAESVGVSQTTVSRWRRGQQGVDAAIAIRFAKAVGDSPLTALVEAGYLTAAEAKARPAKAPDFSQLTNDQLLALVRERMSQDAQRRPPIAPVPDRLAADIDHDSPRAWDDQRPD